MISARHSSSPEQFSIARSPKTLLKHTPFDVEALSNSHEDEQLDDKDDKEEITDNSLTVPNLTRQKDPITSNNSVNNIKNHNCDGLGREEGNDAIELSSILSPNPENNSKRSSESIAT